MTSTTSAARTATLEDDQYNERRHRTIIFSSARAPRGDMRDLANLIQVYCQFGSRPKPLQNNNLQFDVGLFQAHCSENQATAANELPLPGCRGYDWSRRSKMTSTTSAARTATLEDDQYIERRHRTIIF